MKKLFVYLKKYSRECVLAPLFKLFEATLELIVPLIVAAIIDRGIGGSDGGYIVRMGLVLAAFAAVGLLFSITAQFFAAKAAIGFSASLRSALLKKIQSLSYSDLDGIGISALITRMTSDVNQVQTGVNLTLRLLLRSPFVVFGAMVMAFTIDTKSALIFAGVIALLCVVVFLIMLTTVPMHRRVQGALDDVTSLARENLNGVRVLRAFLREDDEIEEFKKCSDRLNRLQLSASRLSALMNPLTLIIINAAVILLIHTGSIKVDSGTLTQGEVVALYNLMSQILVELIKMANLIITLTKSLACADRIGVILNTESTVLGGSAVPDSTAPRGKVEFRDVSFKYNGAGANAVEGISFSALPGQTIGIIGGTGSGKTTIMSLIPSFYGATQGEVLIDGINALEFDRNELRKRIGIVPQKAVLFKGTIRSNLLMGNELASEDEMLEALETAQALEIVQNKEKGLDEPIQQGGSNLSGGQKQRLTIARALVKKPEILILDDSSSALDYVTDAKLRLAIRNMKNPPTTFIVSQRAQSIRYVDTIIVLDDGRMAGIGTHDELMKNCTVYREIFVSQFPNGDELS